MWPMRPEPEILAPKPSPQVLIRGSVQNMLDALESHDYADCINWAAFVQIETAKLVESIIPNVTDIRKV